MRLEWDEAKRRANLSKHDVDFRDLGPLFDDVRRIEFEDRRRAYGELRMVLLGLLYGRLLHVTWTRRRDARRIISARRANLREQRFYGRYRADHPGDRDP